MEDSRQYMLKCVNDMDVFNNINNLEIALEKMQKKASETNLNIKWRKTNVC